MLDGYQEGLDVQSFREHREPNSSVLFTSFSGIEFIRLPSFRWGPSFSLYPVNSLLVRDVRQLYYQAGVPGGGETAASLGDFLRQYVVERAYRAVLSIGHSSGGYAAILFGTIMGADVVHAFSPHTRLPARSLTQTWRTLFERRSREAKTQFRIRYDRRLDRQHYDLRDILTQNPNHPTIHIYYGTRHPRDSFNAERLADLPNVILHPYDTADHHVVRMLADDGTLVGILDETYRELALKAGDLAPAQ